MLARVSRRIRPGRVPKKGNEGPPESADAETRFREMPVIELLEALEWVQSIRGDHTPGLDRKQDQLINDIASVGFETLRDRENDIRAAGLTHRADRWLHYENYL
jgi:hypothetical protein